MSREYNTDYIAGLIGLIITLFFKYFQEDVNRLSIMFPNAIIIILGCTSVSLIIKGFIKPTRSTLFDVGSNIRWIVTGLLFFGWVIAIPFLGFLVSTISFFALIVFYLSRTQLKVTKGRFLIWLGVIVVEVLFFYLIFAKVLHAPLPEGMFI
ncbi:tripartite tricarboxylate transporter TctB family protein [bacterium]|nr:tripartite tricarboxylate transporter TctB family protein [bacterium]